jgi:methylmalonyl-CoA/ethylmalonyl-CoA epimerase
MDLHDASIAQILIPVADLDRAVTFYRDTLGLPFLFSAPPQMSFFQAGAVRLLLAVPEGSAPENRTPLIYFKVADIHGVCATLLERGLPLEAPPHVVHRTAATELWLAEFHDPDGNQLALMGETGRSQ